MNYSIFFMIKKNYSCIYICPSPGGAGCSHKMDIAGCIYVGHNEPLWAPVHKHAQKTQTGLTVSLGSHTQKGIRNMNGSTFLLHLPKRTLQTTFCGLSTPKGSSKILPCHSVHLHFMQSRKACSLIWDLQIWPELSNPGFSYSCMGGCTCLLLGSRWLVSQGICYRASMGSLDKRSCGECPSHSLEVQLSSLRSTLGCVKS